MSKHGNSQIPVTPFLFGDIESVGNWRDRIAWPIPMLPLRASGERVCEAILDFVAGLPDDIERQVALVAAGRSVNAMMSLAEAGLVAQADIEGRLQAVGGPPEMSYLLGRTGEPSALVDARRGRGTRDVTRASWPILRTLARTWTWSGTLRLPLSALAPRAIALSHNSLLVTTARRTRARVRYASAANILDMARRRSTSAGTPDVRSLAAMLAPRLTACFPTLGPDMRHRVERAFVGRISPVLEQTAADAKALRQINLPDRVWRGTGGSYATRAITTEIRRRGGEVTGFDHGGVNGISQLAHLTAIIELMESSSFVVGTPAWKDAVEASAAPRLVAPVNQAKIRAGRGETLFIDACLDTKRSPKRKRRVLYIGHPYRGLRQFAIVVSPDAIYWDLQSRVAAAIALWDVDLMCKPHPEGVFVGMRNPIADIAPTSTKRFEEHLSDTDVFVFDAPTSTTFAEALCTNRPVVLIERGYFPFNPAVEPAIRARVRTVRSTTDDKGRIWPDMAALEEAVCGGPEEADPTVMRRLFAGIGEAAA